MPDEAPLALASENLLPNPSSAQSPLAEPSVGPAVVSASVVAKSAPAPTTGAPSSTATLAKPAAAPAQPVELAPEGTDCPHCGQRMRVYARYDKNIEYCCPGLKEDPPVLADKYADWRDLLLKSRVSRPL